MHQNMSLGSNGVHRVRSLQKILCDFAERTFALIAPVQPILYQASWSNKTIKNASKHYETHQTHEFRAQWCGSGAFVAKNSDATSLARTFALIAPVQPVLYRASCSNETIPNVSKHEFGANCVDWVHSLRKILMRLRARTFALIALVQPVLHRALCSNKTIQNAPKHYETHQYMSLGFNGVDQVRSLWKIPMQFHGTNSCINCTSSTRFAPTFV